MSQKKDHHADGQHDHNSGKYSQPHGIVKELLTFNANEQQKIIDDNREYDSGWRNAKNQDR